MKLMTLTRTSLLPVSACAPSTMLPVAAAAAPLAAGWAAPAPRAHQIQVQAELVQMADVREIDGNKGTTGFKGNDSISSKRYTDGGSGVPPRGRPV